jgi:hypothetical protein
MSQFLLGFVACYAGTAALLLSYGWRNGAAPADVGDCLRELGLALIWPAAFFGGDDR